MRLNRRQFLRVLQATGGVAVTAGCRALERGYPERYSVDKPPVPGASNWAPGEERYVRSACLQCQGGCGIVVRVVEGRAVKIEGNPDYPTNQGGLCPKGLNGLQVLYDPDRIRGPMERIGPRGGGKWKPLSWDEAIARVARALADLRARGQAHTVAFFGGRYRGHMRELVRRFLRAYGSPNDIDHEALCSPADTLAHDLSQGIRGPFAYDWERTRYVLSFGTGFVESFRPTAMMLRVFGQMHARAPGQRTKLVQIDPRFGVSSARADEWVPIRPGTDAALALGLAHVIVRERLYDEALVRDHTFGFDGWTGKDGRRHLGFRDLVLERYAPEAVAEVTDVSPDTIERLAHEFATHRPAVAVGGRGVAAHTNGVYALLAVHALNALVGSIDAPGGVLVQRRPPFAEWPELEVDEVARQGLARPRFDLDGEDGPPFCESRMDDIARRLEEGKPYRLGAVFLYYTNPLFSSTEPQRLRDALRNIPLVIGFSPFLCESTAMADLVLPDHTYLERWQLDEVTPSVGFPVFAMRQPVVEPLHNTRSTGQVLVEVARALGGAVGRAFPDDELDMIKRLVKGVHESGRGSIAASDFDEFWEKLLQAGGWWDPPYRFGQWAQVLRTPSGKYEFFATRIEERLGTLGDDALARLGLRARGDELCLPHYEPAHSNASESDYPFELLSYKPMTHSEGRGANQPHLQELFGVQFDRSWEPWVEIHPEDARTLGVKDEDRVWLRSPTGSARLRVVLNDGTRPGVIAAPFEYGHTFYGRWAAGRGESVNALVVLRREPLSGGVAWNDTRVRVERA